MINTLYVGDLVETSNPLLDVKRNVPYFVIGVEGDECSDIDLLENRYGKKITIDLFAVVPNPRYLEEGGHYLQLAWITFKE